VLDGGRDASSWWRVVTALRREGWFSDHVSREVGNRKGSMFWSDVWVGGVTFRDKFSRLFYLSLLKEVSVFEASQLGWGEDGETWKWRMVLFTWEEEMVGELCLLLQNVILQVDKYDKWLWNLESSKDFVTPSLFI